MEGGSDKKWGGMSKSLGSQQMDRLLEALAEGPVDQMGFLDLFTDPAVGRLEPSVISPNAAKRTQEFERAREGIVALGIRLVEEDGRWRLDSETPLGDRRAFALSVSQSQVLSQIEEFCNQYAGKLIHEVDPALLSKSLMHHRVQFLYSDEEIQGTLYGVQPAYGQKDRPILYIRTDQGDQAFYADAMDVFKDLQPADVEVEDGDFKAQVRAATPLKHSRLTEGDRGRPTNASDYRIARRVKFALRDLCPSVGDSIEIDALAHRLQIRARVLRAKLSLISSMDRTLSWDAQRIRITRIEEPRHLGQLLDGMAAMVARAYIRRIDLLGDGVTEILSNGDPEGKDELLDDFNELRATLDSFLTHLVMSSDQPPAPCGAELLAVVLACGTYPLQVKVLGSKVIQELVIDDLFWNGTKWYLRGTLNGELLGDFGLEVSHVIEVMKE